MKILKSFLIILLVALVACSDDDDSGTNGPLNPNQLEGLYAHWTIDVLGYCGGLCWTTHYFFRDGTVLYDIGSGPDVNWENPSCTGDDCRTYSISNGQIMIEGEPAMTFERISQDKLKMKDSEFEHLESYGELKLNGLYYSYNYASDPANGTGAGVSIFLKLNSDGTYSEKGTGFGYAEEATVIDKEEHSGTYKITDYLIEFKSDDGGQSQMLFFLPEGRSNDLGGSPKMIHIGGRDYLQKQ